MTFSWSAWDQSCLDKIFWIGVTLATNFWPGLCILCSRNELALCSSPRFAVILKSQGKNSVNFVFRISALEFIRLSCSNVPKIFLVLAKFKVA